MPYGYSRAQWEGTGRYSHLMSGRFPYRDDMVNTRFNIREWRAHIIRRHRLQAARARARWLRLHPPPRAQTQSRSEWDGNIFTAHRFR